MLGASNGVKGCVDSDVVVLVAAGVGGGAVCCSPRKGCRELAFEVILSINYFRHG